MVESLASKRQSVCMQLMVKTRAAVVVAPRGRRRPNGLTRLSGVKETGGVWSAGLAVLMMLH